MNKCYKKNDFYYKLYLELNKETFCFLLFENDNYTEQKVEKFVTLTLDQLDGVEEITELEFYLTYINYSDYELVLNNLENIFNSTKLFKDKTNFKKLINSIENNINGLYINKDNPNYDNFKVKYKQQGYSIIFEILNSKNEILESKEIELDYRLNSECHCFLLSSETAYYCLDPTISHSNKMDYIVFPLELTSSQALFLYNQSKDLETIKYHKELIETMSGTKLKIVQVGLKLVEVDGHE